MITNPKGKVYVGSTVNFTRRMRFYRHCACKEQYKIYNSLLKYKPENHTFEIVWSGNIDDMYKYETLIGWGFNVLEPDNLNLCLPKLGDIYSCVSDETRSKIAKGNVGRILSQESKDKIKLSKQKITRETRDKMSIAARGKIVTDETKENMRLGQIGRKHTSDTKLKISQWQIGKKLSEETKLKISNSHKGKKISKEYTQKAALGHMKPIIQYTLDDVFIKEWESSKIAGKELNIDNSGITKCCKNVLKTSGNFKWKYKL